MIAGAPLGSGTTGRRSSQAKHNQYHSMASRHSTIAGQAACSTSFEPDSFGSHPATELHAGSGHFSVSSSSSSSSLSPTSFSASSPPLVLRRSGGLRRTVGFNAPTTVSPSSFTPPELRSISSAAANDPPAIDAKPNKTQPPTTIPSTKTPPPKPRQPPQPDFAKLKSIMRSAKNRKCHNQDWVEYRGCFVPQESPLGQKTSSQSDSKSFYRSPNGSPKVDIPQRTIRKDNLFYTDAHEFEQRLIRTSILQKQRASQAFNALRAFDV